MASEASKPNMKRRKSNKAKAVFDYFFSMKLFDMMVVSSVVALAAGAPFTVPGVIIGISGIFIFMDFLNIHNKVSTIQEEPQSEKKKRANERAIKQYQDPRTWLRGVGYLGTYMTLVLLCPMALVPGLVVAGCFFTPILLILLEQPAKAFFSFARRMIRGESLSAVPDFERPVNSPSGVRQVNRADPISAPDPAASSVASAQPAIFQVSSENPQAIRRAI